MESQNSNSGLGLESIQKQHISFMEEIVKSLSDTPSVLKGGTALLLAYGLDRFSEDIDLDSTKSLNLESKIKAAAKKLNLAISSIKVKKDTGTTKRYIVKYSGSEGKNSLKVETSFRSKEIPANDVTVHNGLKVYKVEKLLEQKLKAASDRGAVRDLYDLNFLAVNHSSAFTPKQIKHLSEFSSNPESLASKYKADHYGDSILNDRDLDDLVLNFHYNVKKLSEGLNKVRGEDDYLLNTAVESKSNQEADLGQAYTEALDMAIQAKTEQVGALEDRLEHMIDKAQSKLQQITLNRPSFLALPKQRAKWQQSRAVQNARIQQLNSRLESVKEIKEGMGVHLPKLEELAINKVTFENPALVAAFHKQKEEQRKKQLKIKEKSNSNSIKSGITQNLSLNK